jgi:hypothetical protein
MKLNKTLDLMCSEDYKDRFKAEYYQLENRCVGLEQMLIKYQDGTLPFTPNCSYDLLNGQLKAMEVYQSYLDERAVIEGVEL